MIKRWKLILACFVIVGLGAYIGTKFTTPLYQSSALVEVAISSSSSDINNLLASDQLVQTESTLATSNPVLSEVASHYKGMTVDQLTREVSASARLNTQIFEIDVLDANSTRAAAIANDVAATLIKQQEQTFQQETASGGFLIIVQNAQPGRYPVQPNTMLNTGAGLLAGLFLGILLAILIEQFDTRVRTAEELTRMLSWPILTTIWQTNAEEVLNPARQSPNSEAYRILRTNIGFSVIDRPLRSLLITSVQPREGKSAIAANLAIFMAKAGKNTLLVDADLYRPVQHTQFGLTHDQSGLSNAIVALNAVTTGNSFFQQQLLSTPHFMRQSNTPVPPNFSLEPFMHPVGIPNLQLMPAGPLPPNPSELLASKALQRLLPFIENCGAEVIIFDAPPLLGLSDTSNLAAMVGVTLFVVDMTQAKKKHLKQAKALLAQTGTRVLGSVLNKQRRRRNDASFIYYYNEEQNDTTGQEVQNGIMSQEVQNGQLAFPVNPPFPSLHQNQR